jgi:hypothetical protein
MWSEWLRRTLRPRGGEAAAGDAREEAPRRRPRLAAPPELEADGLHPGADEYRAALASVEED